MNEGKAVFLDLKGTLVTPVLVDRPVVTVRRYTGTTMDEVINWILRQ